MTSQSGLKNLSTNRIKFNVIHKKGYHLVASKNAYNGSYDEIMHRRHLFFFVLMRRYLFKARYSRVA